MPLSNLYLQYEVMMARSTNNVAGKVVHTIENVVSVRDIGWEIESDNITVTTDNKVCLPPKVEYQNFDLFISSLGPPVPSGDMFRVSYMWGVHGRRLISSVWLVYSGGQVLSEVSVSRQLSAREMGAELQ